ncbi:MAG: hypothetical protein AAGE59_01335 [Cyanobacteria bacterium P01_F01_bin.86]
MFDLVALADFFDARLLLVLSPITTAIAWVMLVHELPILKHPWWF